MAAKQRAFELIGPKPEDRETCESHIMLALDHVERYRRDLPYIIRRESRAGKRAALQLERVLENLAKALTDDKLPDDVGLVIRRHPFDLSLFPGLPTLTKPEV